MFDGPSEYQLAVGGRKLVAGEVVSDQNAVLVRCFLPLSGDLARIAEVLNFNQPGERLALIARLGYRAATLESLLGSNVSFAAATVAISDALATNLNLTFQLGEISTDETALLENIMSS